MDTGGLYGRGISEVDIGHDDRTTLKSGLHFFCAIYLNYKLPVRTLADSKLGVDLFRGSASLELYRGSSLQVAAQRLQKKFIYCL